MNEELINEDIQIVDERKVKKVKETLPSDELIFDLAELFKVFGDSTRMKIICALLEEELCVGDIASITNSTPSAISHQLRVLKQSKLVKYRKEGKIVYYSLDDAHIKEILEKATQVRNEQYSLSLGPECYQYGSIYHYAPDLVGEKELNKRVINCVPVSFEYYDHAFYGFWLNKKYAMNIV